MDLRTQSLIFNPLPRGFFELLLLNIHILEEVMFPQNLELGLPEHERK